MPQTQANRSLQESATKIKAFNGCSVIADQTIADATLIGSRPVLSICIPTYNRGKLLDKLFETLSVLKAEYKRDIEVCVSNNCSTDHTQDVIKAWGGRFELNTISQKSNIGGSRNFIEVSKIATGRQLLWIGDDDTIVLRNFSRLMDLLKRLTEKRWVLVGIANKDGEEFLLNGLDDGECGVANFRWLCLKVSLFQFGFIGMHVIPSESFFQGFADCNRHVSAWPHLKLLLAYSKSGTVQVLKTPIVEQAGGGKELFWRLGDWMTVSFSKIITVLDARRETHGSRRYYTLQGLRELYSFTLAKNTVLWKLLENDTFNQRATKDFQSIYKMFGGAFWAALPHLLALTGLKVIPAGFLRGMIIYWRPKTLTNYEIEKKRMAKFDAFGRGI